MTAATAMPTSPPRMRNGTYLGALRTVISRRSVMPSRSLMPSPSGVRSSEAMASSLLSGRKPCVHEPLLLFAQEVPSGHPHDVPGLEIGKAAGECHAGRGAGGDEIPGLEDHVLRQAPHEFGGPEDHVLRGALLAWLAVDPGHELDGARVYSRSGHQPRAHRVEGGAGLAQRPLRAGVFQLVLPL